MSLKLVTEKIKSIDKTKQVTKAMEAVSAVKMRKSQAFALEARPYARTALNILKSLSKTADIETHPLAEVRPVRKSCFIVVTSDKGLAGSLNSNVIKKTEQMIKDQKLSREDVSIVAIGGRGKTHFEKHGYNIIASYEKWGDHINFEDISPLIEKIRPLFEEKHSDDVWIFYTNFVSTLQQEVYKRRVLPITSESVTEVVEGIVPDKGKFSKVDKNDKQKEETSLKTDPIFEPSAESLLETLIPVLLKIHIYHSVLEANASEHSTRMVAMKNASESATDILKDLRLSYNKVRQAAITNEMSEIVGGMESLSDN